MKQARGAAKTTIKMKNLKKGTTLENTYNSGAKFETAEIVRKASQYTYEDEVREEIMYIASFSSVPSFCNRDVTFFNAGYQGIRDEKEIDS